MARYASRRTTPTDDQLARLGATFEAFSRRYKMTESIRAEKPLNELNKQAPCFVASLWRIRSSASPFRSTRMTRRTLTVRCGSTRTGAGSSPERCATASGG